MRLLSDFWSCFKAPSEKPRRRPAQITPKLRIRVETLPPAGNNVTTICPVTPLTGRPGRLRGDGLVIEEARFLIRKGPSCAYGGGALEVRKEL